MPDATAQPREYVQTLLDILGDRDPLDVIAATPALVAELTAGAADERLASPPAPGEWSALELVGHLMDVEVVFGFRLRLTVTEEAARYPGYDEKAWARLPRPAFAEVLAAYTALRAVNLHLLRELPADVWSRVGYHSEQGEDPFSVQVRKLAGHDLAHLDQLRRTLR